MMVFQQGVEEGRQLTEWLAKDSARWGLFFDSGLEELFKCLRASEMGHAAQGLFRAAFSTDSAPTQQALSTEKGEAGILS